MTSPRPGDTPVAYKDLTPLGPTAPVYICECNFAACPNRHERVRIGHCDHCGKHDCMHPMTK